MGTTERRADTAVIEAMQTRGKSFGFFQAVQLLHRLRPDAVPVGEHGPAHQEPVHFHHDPALTFSASDVSSIEVSPDGHEPPILTTTFLGLTGAASPLAMHFSEEVIAAENNDEHSLRGFYDLWHHRVLSLFFRAWKKYRFSAGFHADLGDVFSRRALSLVGIDASGAAPERGLPPSVQLSLAPLLAMRTRSARALRIVVQRMFPGMDVSIEQFVVRRALIDTDDRVRLGVRNTQLSTNLTLGAHCVDRSGRFRLVLGPMSREASEDFVPGGRHFARLRDVVGQFTRGVLECELELQVAEGDSGRFQLGGAGAVLGVTTQLAGQPRPVSMRVLLSDDLSQVKVSIVHQRDAAA
jgi:type VI secretion system protein ImpH